MLVCKMCLSYSQYALNFITVPPKYHYCVFSNFHFITHSTPNITHSHFSKLTFYYTLHPNYYPLPFSFYYTLLHTPVTHSLTHSTWECVRVCKKNMGGFSVTLVIS